MFKIKKIWRNFKSSSSSMPNLFHLSLSICLSLSLSMHLRQKSCIPLPLVYLKILIPFDFPAATLTDILQQLLTASISRQFYYETILLRLKVGYHFKPPESRQQQNKVAVVSQLSQLTERLILTPPRGSQVPIPSSAWYLRLGHTTATLL